MELTISLIAIFVSFILALFVYQKNSKSASHVYLSALIFLNGLYSVFNYLAVNASSNSEAFFWAKLILYISILVGPLFYSFVKTFPDAKFIFNKKIQIFILSWIVINFILATLGLIFSNVTIENHQLDIRPGSAVFSFGLLQLLTAVAASWSLAKKYMQSSGLLKLQLRYITFGIVISFALTLISTLLLPLFFKNTLLIPISPVFLLIAAISVSYSVIRHRLLDINLIVARTVAYALVLIVIGGFYALAVFLVGSRVFQIPFSEMQFYLYGMLTIIAAFTFQPLHKTLEQLTDAVFYKGYYEPRTLMKSLSSIMSTTIVLQSLTLQILDLVLQEMRITRGVFILLDKKGENIEHIENKGYEDKKSFLIKDFNQFITHKEIVFFDDLEESSTKKYMREHRISVALPLNVHAQKIGMLFLGEKSSGEIYSDHDRSVLELLAPELSVAIQNARDYEEIKRFNLTLSEEIEKATEQTKKVNQELYKKNTDLTGISKELSLANEKLRALDKLKDEFVSLASHELRTPMTAIKYYLWFLLNDKEKSAFNEKQTTYLQRAYTSTDRLISLVNDMLNVSRIEGGRMIINKKPTDLKQLAQEVIAEILPTAQKQGLDVVIGEMPENMRNVQADSEKIKQVLINLVGNSLKFTPPTGKITISFIQKDGKLETIVHDTGKGISPEDISKLFVKFGMVGNNYLTRQNTQGTGLGLYISKSIVELHGGKIWAQSEGLDKGATFHFTLEQV